MQGVTSKFKVAIVQLAVQADKAINLQRASAKISEAAFLGAKLAILPECFNSPYGTSYFSEFSESIPDGPTCQMLSAAARQHSLWLIGGTLPERSSDGRLYNTCTVYDPQGRLAASYRKTHLFDIEIPGKIAFHESDTLQAGNQLCTIDILEGVRVGLGICYDLRFPELASILTQRGCHLLVYPGAFNTVTGPLHWKLLQQSRAIDNQLFVLSASPAHLPTATYQAYGHSMVVDPMGMVLAEAGAEESLLTVDLDLSIIQETRRNIPVWRQRRTDLYSLPTLK